jgi:hypothetical protein
MIENARQQVVPLQESGKENTQEEVVSEEESTAAAAAAAAAAKIITANSIVFLTQTLSGPHLVPDRRGVIFCGTMCSGAVRTGNPLSRRCCDGRTKKALCGR